MVSARMAIVGRTGAHTKVRPVQSTGFRNMLFSVILSKRSALHSQSKNRWSKHANRNSRLCREWSSPER